MRGVGRPRVSLTIRDCKSRYFAALCKQGPEPYVILLRVRALKHGAAAPNQSSALIKSHVKTLVSVIIPAYNGERFIAQSLQSVLNQTIKDLEIVIVDDGSTDTTAEIVREFQRADSRIRYIAQANLGQAAARNTGAAAAAGDLIAFLDQDDLWLDHKLEVQIRALKESGADVVFSNGHIFGHEPSDDNMSFPVVHGKFSGTEMFPLLFNQNQIPLATALVRADAFAAAGRLDENPLYQNADDYDFWLRLAGGGRMFVGLPEKLIRYRIHSGQASTDAVKMLKAELAVLRKHEHNSLLNGVEKAPRFHSMYYKLVLALVEVGEYKEARQYLQHILAQEDYPIGVRAQALALRLLPSHFKSIMDLSHRIRESVGYRIAGPLRRVLNQARSMVANFFIQIMIVC
ncbi:MAG: hypothetical protein QOH71_688 [Blastocatellia bacterium]|nr:hypothetical protein [Blastocatellia bacterium]